MVFGDVMTRRRVARLVAAVASLTATPTGVSWAQEPSAGQGLGTRTFQGGTVMVPQRWDDVTAIKIFRDLGATIRPSRQGQVDVQVPEQQPSARPQLTIKPPASEAVSAPAVAVDQKSLVERTQRVERLAGGGREREKSALTDLVQSFRQISVPTVSIPENSALKQLETSLATVRSLGVPTRSGGSVVPDRFTTTATSGSLGGNAAVAAAIEKARGRGLRVDERQLQLLPSADRVDSAGTRSSSGLFSFSQQYRQAIDRLDLLLRNPAQPESLSSLREAAEATRDQYVRADRSRATPEDRRLAARVIDALEAQPELKAIYMVPTNFDPPSYRQVYVESRRTVGISDGNRIVCSGLLLDTQWVLTAGHCFINDRWQDMKVVFSKDGFSQEKLPAAVIDMWPDPPPGKAGTDNLDYAFIRFDDMQIVELVGSIDKEVATIPAGGRRELRPLCLHSGAMKRSEPVYVIAHKHDIKKVHDHAYVVIPFRVNERTLAEVKSDQERRLWRLADTFKDDMQAKSRFVTSSLARLEASYKLVPSSGPEKIYHFMSVGTDFEGARPFFMLDTDTEHGNSGGPVFSRNTNCLIGVFAAGMGDRTFSEASIKQVEYATPISEVLSHIRELAKHLDPPGDDATTARIEQRRKLIETLVKLEGDAS